MTYRRSFPKSKMTPPALINTDSGELFLVVHILHAALAIIIIVSIANLGKLLIFPKLK